GVDRKRITHEIRKNFFGHFWKMLFQGCDSDGTSASAMPAQRALNAHAISLPPATRRDREDPPGSPSGRMSRRILLVLPGVSRLGVISPTRTHGASRRRCGKRV